MSLDGEKKELSGKQLQAITHLASGKTIDATAKLIGINERTIDRWKTDSTFRAALKRAELELFEASFSAIKKTIPAAIVCLVRNMDKDTSAYVQVQAASKLLDLAVELFMDEQAARRIDELEQKLLERHGGS